MSYQFTDQDAVKANWWKKEKIGDSIQGTLVKKFQQLNQLSGKDQWIYEIKTENGEFWNVGGTFGIDAQMRNINLGQIIKFEFIEERPSKKAGLDPAKIVQVYSNKNAIDKEWLQEQESNPNIEPESQEQNAPNDSEENEINVDSIPFGDTNEEKEAKIVALAKEKLEVTDDTKVKEVVMEKTGLAYIDSNLDNIIAKLEEM